MSFIPEDDFYMNAKTFQQKTIKLNEIGVQAKISSELYRDRDDRLKKEVQDNISHQITTKLVQELIAKGLIEIVNVTQVALDKNERGERLDPFEYELLEEHRRDGIYLVKGYFNVDTISILDSSPLRNIDRNEDMEFLWKLLPPRINGLPEKEHPLNPGWMGTIKRERDKPIINRVKKVLNKI